jgi:protein-L-isoaspartate O-methyltransferase
VVAFEINPTLAEGLKQSGLAQTVICADFLDCVAVDEKFDAVLMNPPFANGDDIQHITHALTMLKPGGRLVAICANGPRQQAALGPLVTQYGGTWEDLPAGTFKASGTGVNTALIVLTA